MRGSRAPPPSRSAGARGALAPDRIHPRHTACYIRGGQVPALHAEFAARDVPGLTAFEVKPWAMKEFAIIDLHGNLLRFGCAPEETGD